MALMNQTMFLKFILFYQDMFWMNHHPSSVRFYIASGVAQKFSNTLSKERVWCEPSPPIFSNQALIISLKKTNKNIHLVLTSPAL